MTDTTDLIFFFYADKIDDNDNLIHKQIQFLDNSITKLNVQIQKFVKKQTNWIRISVCYASTQLSGGRF